MLGLARSVGHRRLRATVWDWNTLSRRLLAGLGFTEVATDERSGTPGPHGTTLVATIEL